MILKLSKREEFLLWKLLEFGIHRYILCISRRNSGAERAEIHLKMSETILETLQVKTYNGRDFNKKKKVHDIIAQELTDNLDKTIDMDLDFGAELDYDILADRFFRKLLKIDYKI